MTRYSSDFGRTPLSPLALMLKDLYVGMKITRFNTEIGIMDRLTVASEPDWNNGSPQIDVIDESGRHRSMYLTDMGIEPYGGGMWNPTNFTIPRNREASLPKTTPRPKGRDYGEGAAPIW